MASSTRILSRRRQWLELRRNAPLAVHCPSACSGVKALRNTSDAKAASRQAPLAFRSLDPSARSGNLIAGDGTKNGLSRSEQRTVSKPRGQSADPLLTPGPKPLDRESPIQVSCEPDFNCNYKPWSSADESDTVSWTPKMGQLAKVEPCP